MTITPNELFDNAFVITINNDRLFLFRRILTACGLGDHLPKTFWGFVNQDLKGTYKCTLSHAAIIKMAKCLNLPFVLLMEDDAFPCNGLTDKLKKYLSDIPTDAKILSLGWSHLGEHHAFGNNYFALDKLLFGTHSYIIFKDGYDDWLKTYNNEPTRFADHFFEHLACTTGKVYTTREPLFIQYCESPSMNGYKGYIFECEPHDKPPRGFPKLEDILKDAPFTTTALQNVDIRDIISSMGKFIYRANGGNVGDFLISAAEMQLFDDMKAAYELVTRANRAALTSSKFRCIYGGGGGWVNLYNFDAPRKEIFENPNLEKCLILPSTFHKVDSLVRSFDERFTVCCRDHASYDYCTNLNHRAKFLLHDDMALGLDISRIDYSTLPKNSNDRQIVDACRTLEDYLAKTSDREIAPFLRCDAEKTVSMAGQFDLSALFSRYGEDITKIFSEEAARIMLYAINKFDSVKTNRLHVMIASHLLNKKVEAYDNSYGKVGNVYQYSLKNDLNIHFIEPQPTTKPNTESPLQFGFMTRPF